VSSPRKILSAIAVVSAWTLVATASATACSNTNVQVTGLAQGQMESSIGCLINQQRTSRGLAAVSPNGDLRRAALSHSTEMVNQGYFEHTSPGGVSFIDRIRATGYMNAAGSWFVGENLVWGTGSLSTPQSLVTSWMNSPPHRANLLNTRFREIGIAAVVGTPESRGDGTGVTVSSEYGVRSAVAGKSAHRARARKAKKKHRRGNRKVKRHKRKRHKKHHKHHKLYRR
jgi:uncharacterized protein YkwD